MYELYAWNWYEWLGCRDLSALGAYSIQGVAGQSGSPWISQAPTFHLSEVASLIFLFKIINISNSVDSVNHHRPCGEVASYNSCWWNQPAHE